MPQGISRQRPNVILILADDMGFSDLGIMGSEIATPHIDGIARSGVLLTSMYNCARCCPTRASLLTGLYPHNAGIGHMDADLGVPGYQGYLRDDAATIAQRLKEAGYRTLMSGKWHVGGGAAVRNPKGALERLPRQRGFDRFYGIADGATHYYHPHSLMQDDEPIETPASDYYFTDAITDHAIRMIEESAGDRTPFFLYLAHTAPHWPLHAHEEDIARFDGVYRRGWDQVRTARHEEMQARGVLQHRWELSPRDADARPWAEAAHPDWEASRMATYAAMIHAMDRAIGRVMTALRRLGVYDDTLVLFLSDNGGCAEFLGEDFFSHLGKLTLPTGETLLMGNRPGLRPGGAITYMSYDLPWANVSNAPFRLFKHWVHEGGISTPLLVQWPAAFKGPRIEHEACHVADILPTILEAAGVPASTTVTGRSVQPLDGESFLSLLLGRGWHREQPIFWEHEGNCAVRDGKFKLVRRYRGPWELYDMERDRTELHDLAERDKPRVQRMVRQFDEWASRVGVMDWTEARNALKRLWQTQGS